MFAHSMVNTLICKSRPALWRLLSSRKSVYNHNRYHSIPFLEPCDYITIRIITDRQYHLLDRQKRASEQDGNISPVTFGWRSIIQGAHDSRQGALLCVFRDRGVSKYWTFIQERLLKTRQSCSIGTAIPRNSFPICRIPRHEGPSWDKQKTGSRPPTSSTKTRNILHHWFHLEKWYREINQI